MKTNKKDISVLIVDDDQSTREVYRDLLKLAGFSIIESQDGKDALTKFKQHLPQVVFTGIDLPGSDGFSLITHIRESDLPQPFFIVNSHNDRQIDRAKAVEFNVDGFFVRGFSAPKNVIDLITALTKKRSRHHSWGADPIFWDRSRFEDVTEKYGMKLFLLSAIMIFLALLIALFVRGM
ncbi:MAG: response regulator [Candidatus Moraniibacteriota bacterium]|nr:MAG: response regulator [Candidatus Moranbacteria bacterium]